MKAIDVAKKFGIKVTIDDSMECSGEHSFGKKIRIRSDASEYTILHEVGHVICGYMCCREHCEYAAHGSALALAKAYKIKLKKRDMDLIDNYAGWSSHKACGAIEKRKEKK